MPRANRGCSSVLPRSIVVAIALTVVAALAGGTGAGAVTQAQIDKAEAEFERLQDEIAAKQEQVAAINAQADEIAGAIGQAQSAYDTTTGDLIETRERIARAEQTYDERVALLEDRAREAFMNGTAGSNLEFLLDAGSFADLADRLQFVDQVTAADADIATEVANLRAQLRDDEVALEKLQAAQKRQLARLADKQAELDRKFAEAQTIMGQIKLQRTEAADAISKLKKKRRQELAAQYGGTVSNGVLKVCPVGQPHGFGDSFGAPRYGGGYHLHKGVDIFAPMGTPIYATFDGVAEVASNGLGGLSVIVRGSAGYTYNAHMSGFGQLGAVQTGDVIGYVGDSGDAQGTSPHDHFEWHPNVIPSNWPPSAYGYPVIDDAINPYPLLTQVC